MDASTSARLARRPSAYQIVSTGSPIENRTPALPASARNGLKLLVTQTQTAPGLRRSPKPGESFKPLCISCSLRTILGRDRNGQMRAEKIEHSRCDGGSLMTLFIAHMLPMTNVL